MADRIFIALCMIEGVCLTATFLLQGRENLGELIGEWMKKMAPTFMTETRSLAMFEAYPMTVVSAGFEMV